jgi:hypothetical protein
VAGSSGIRGGSLGKESSGIRGGSLGKAIGSSLGEATGSSLGKAMGSFLGKENSVSIVEADKDGCFFVPYGFSGLRC